MKYIFIDTNIFIICTMMYDGEHDITVITKLKNILEEGKAILLLPETVEFEYKKNIDRKYAELKQQLNSIKKALKKSFTLTELTRSPFTSPLRDNIFQKFDEFKRHLNNNKNMVTDELGVLFNHEKTVRIPLTPEIILKTYRRCVKGVKPYDNKIQASIQADCTIVESLQSYELGNEDVLIFCTNNKHFAEEGLLSTEIAEGFSCHTILYSSLLELLEKEFTTSVGEDEANKYKVLEQIFPKEMFIPENLLIRKTVSLPQAADAFINANIKLIHLKDKR